MRVPIAASLYTVLVARRRALGLFFILLGLVGVGIGLTSALSELGGMYKNALEHPLDEPAPGGEAGISERMLSAAVTGGVGAIIFTVGMRMAMPRRRR
ncbi:MAG: hypothetical protein AMXMBFR58_22510 [Phycisphaerae bacterium]